MRFADDIYCLTGSQEELVKDLQTQFKVRDSCLETVNQFIYLGALVTDNGSRKEILSRMAKAQSALSKLKIIWRDKNISVKSKIRLMRSLVISIFLYACESWTLDSYLQQRIASFEMRCLRQLLGIDYKQHVTNECVRNIVTSEIGKHQELLEIVKSRKLKWFCHTTHGGGLAKVCLQGTVSGGRARGRPRKKWNDNITEWTGLSFAEATRAADDREGWRRLVRVAASSKGAPTALHSVTGER